MSTASRSAIKDFTSGNIMGHLVSFGIPILLGNLLMILLNTVDMIVVGQVLGEAGSSAISIGGSVSSFINVFVNGFSAAAQIQLSHIVGRGERGRISRYILGVSSFLFVVAVGFMLVLIPLNGTILHLLNTPEEAFDAAWSYSMVCLAGVLPIFADHIISAFLRGMARSPPRRSRTRSRPSASGPSVATSPGWWETASCASLGEVAPRGTQREGPTANSPEYASHSAIE